METRSFLDWLKTPSPSKFYGKYFIFESEPNRVAKYVRIGRVWYERDGRRVESHNFKYVFLDDTNTKLIEGYEQSLGLSWFESAAITFDSETQVIEYLKNMEISTPKAQKSFLKKIFNRN